MSLAPRTSRVLGATVCCILAFASAQAQESSSDPQKASAVTSVAVANVTTTAGGTKGTIPMFTSSNNIENSTLYYNSTGLGIGRSPGGMLDVNGNSIIRGSLDLARSGDATPAKGFPSFTLFFQSSAYDSSSKTNVLPSFQMRSEPTGNDTASVGATMNFLYSANGTPVETGLFINPNGSIHFASAQTFPITTGATGPAGPQGPTGPTGPKGPAGPAGPTGSVAANLTALSGQLSTTGGVAYLGSDKFEFPNTCVIGDAFLSVNGYGGGNALPADGRSLPITNHTAIFSLIGTNFGGDGQTYFQLPDLRAFAPKGMQYSICVFGIFPSLE